MISTAIVPRATIDGIVALRSQAIETFRDGFETLARARQIAKSATPQGYLPMLPKDALNLIERDSGDADKFVKIMTKSVDQAVWDHLINLMGIEKIMDAQARKQFRHQIQTDPPEVTAETCRATMESLIEDADTIFKRGIANAFSALDRRFRSHDGFKIGARIVFDYAFNAYGSWSRYNADDRLRDVERAFHVLDGKEQPDRYAGIVGAIDEQRRSCERHAFRAESEYFRAKAYKNGNLHIWFKREDLVKKVNKVLADYYGAALGAGHGAAEKTFRAKTTPAKHFGFFPTPDDLADEIIIEAMIRPGETVLEPNAGTGSLSRRALDQGGLVTAIEVQPNLISQLEQDSRYSTVLSMDFLEVTPEMIGLYDHVIMNPPFDLGRDIDHVDHAIKFLAPNGRLIAIMSAGTEFREDAKTKAFRAKVERLNGEFRDLPAGSFASAGTMVNTVVLTIRKRS